MLLHGIIVRLARAFEISGEEVAALCEAGGHAVSVARGKELVRDMEVESSPEELSAFLDGLIARERGAPPAGAPPSIPATTNNIVLRKLRIATQCRDEDMLRLIQLGGLSISRHELSALFRRPEHMHYRECGDQIVRKFVIGFLRERRPSRQQARRDF